MVKVYSLDDCDHCENLKNFLNRIGEEYEEMILNKDISFKEFSKLYPNIKKFPYVEIDGKGIGGMIDTARYFRDIYA